MKELLLCTFLLVAISGCAQWHEYNKHVAARSLGIQAASDGKEVSGTLNYKVEYDSAP